jgi:hypothetical protein
MGCRHDFGVTIWWVVCVDSWVKLPGGGVVEWGDEDERAASR